MKIPKFQAVAECPGHYRATDTLTPDDILEAAKRIAASRFYRGRMIVGSETAASHFQLLHQDLEHEEFHVLFLDNQHRVLSMNKLFTGTIDSANVYPREVVKRALSHNAAAAIFFHNHPSGNPEPSKGDQVITKRLQDALELVGVRVLDHIVVGAEGYVSMTKRGML